jgi:hypothetical protein
MRDVDIDGIEDALHRATREIVRLRRLLLDQAAGAPWPEAQAWRECESYAAEIAVLIARAERALRPDAPQDAPGQHRLPLDLGVLS